jgi:hypothetical protein
LQKGLKGGLTLWIVRSQSDKNADAPHPLALLGPRRERPRGRRTADKRDELAPSHASPEAQDEAS